MSWIEEVVDARRESRNGDQSLDDALWEIALCLGAIADALGPSDESDEVG